MECGKGSSGMIYVEESVVMYLLVVRCATRGSCIYIVLATKVAFHGESKERAKRFKLSST